MKTMYPYHKAIAVITGRAHSFMIAFILRSSCFCESGALCMSWITYDHLYYASCLACWALFGSLVPVMCNRTSCAQVRELPHFGDNRESTLFSWLHIYIRVLFSWFHTPVFGVRISILNRVSKTQSLKRKKKEKGI